MMQFRTNRATYWAGLVALFAVTFVIKYFGNKPFAVSEALIALVCVPRLHDIGKSGWIAAGFLALEFILMLISGINLMVMGLYMVVVMGLLIWLGSIPGESKANKWGEIPEPGVQFKMKRRAAS